MSIDPKLSNHHKFRLDIHKMPSADPTHIRATAHMRKGHSPHDWIAIFRQKAAMDTPDLDAVLAIVDERLKLLGLSDREASLKATGKPDAIREMRRGKWPSDRRLRQIAAALETTIDQFITGGPDRRGDFIQALPPAEMAKLDGVDGLPRDIPVFGPRGISLAKNDAPHNVPFNQPLRYACRPPVLKNRDDVFCVIMPDQSLSPRFERGDELYIDPRRVPFPNEYVLLGLANEDPFATEWKLFVRKLMSVTDDMITVGRHNSPDPTAHHVKEIGILHRVIPWGELLSY